MSERIFGVVPPMTTPFRWDDTIDEAALRAETRYLIETARVHGLAVGGSTGEGHALTTDEVRRITAVVVEEARGRVPVIAGVITDSTGSAVERGLAVRDLGVATTWCRGWTYLAPPLLARIIDAVPGVVGVKQSPGDLKLLADLMLLVGDRARVMTAVDTLLYPSFALGAQGAIAAILTAVPGLCVQLWDAVQAGDYKQALGLHERLLPIWNAIAHDNLPANVKHCQALMGRPAGLPRAPMPATSAAQADGIRQALRGAGVLG